ncbi:sarcoplasmic reticulum histidine-rich calcium-binding protein-like [Vespa velutina]|uniref:sarcoplasmic reticulum histidine-rich calcium-binding protein-like n=1 Tax=Vespa velutina TaxID=202808 RepID=UPI001FB3596E|nr:sarcoplasmic reticulum histidine-rich calcium-binding protein-like [Vespa velutina]
MIAITTILVLISIGFNDGSSTKMEKMTISKTSMADLMSSATGYTYEQGQDYPVTYVHYKYNYGNGHYYDTPLHYGSSVGTAAPVAVSVPQTAGFYEKPVISYAYAGQKPSLYVQQQLPYIKLGNDHVTEQGVYVVSGKPLASYHVPVSNEKVEVEDDNQDHTNEKNKEEDDDEKEEYNNEHKDDDHEDDDDEGDDNDDSGYNDTHETHYSSFPSKGFKHVYLEHPQKNTLKLYDKDQGDFDSSQADAGSYLKTESDKQYSEEKHSSYGEKGDSDHNSYDKFDKGQKKLYDTAENAGHYNLKGGHKKEHTDTSNIYGQHDDLEKGEEGAKHEHSSYHKKGGKTNGFHKVYHKDEYKKNTEFYDESHKDGEVSKHFAFDQHHNAKEGDFKKGSNHDSGFDHWDKMKKDDFYEGHDISHNQGHNSKKGEDSYHKDYSDYLKEYKKEVGKKNGFSKAHNDH